MWYFPTLTQIYLGSNMSINHYVGSKKEESNNNRTLSLYIHMYVYLYIGLSNKWTPKVIQRIHVDPSNNVGTY